MFAGAALLVGWSLVVICVDGQADNETEVTSEAFETPTTQPAPYHDLAVKFHLPGPVAEHMALIDKFWTDFKKTHNKVYSSTLESRRKRLWVENLVRIHQHNEEARDGHHSYFLGANHLSDLNVREYIRKLNRLSPARGEFVAAGRPLTKRHTAIPEEWNWVEEGFVTPDWDQKDCGSCYAFSIAASTQGQYFKQTRKIVNLSAQQLVDCSVVTGNMGCHGGSLKNTLKYCTQARGLTDESHYPYKARQHLCHFLPWEKKVNVTSFHLLPTNDEKALERAVYTTGPVACSINASPYTFQLYHKGIYDDPVCSSQRVNHAMLVVGYTKEAWVLKNWWGPHWGMDGYMLLRKGKNRCAVARLAAYPVVVAEETGA